MGTRIHQTLIVLLLLGSGAASAAEVSYVVNQSDTHDSALNLDYTISGVITTDGSLSPGIANVISWSITLWSQQAGGSFVFTPANSQFTAFGEVTATAALDSFVSGVQGLSDQIPQRISRQLIADAQAIKAAFKCAGTSAATGCGDPGLLSPGSR